VALKLVPLISTVSPAIPFGIEMVDIVGTLFPPVFEFVSLVLEQEKKKTKQRSVQKSFLMINNFKMKIPFPVSQNQFYTVSGNTIKNLMEDKNVGYLY
jgi:hypothetical protein